MPITALEDELGSGDDDSAVLPPSGRVALSESDPRLTAMLSLAAESVGLHWRSPPSPKCLRLNDWFLGAKANFRQSPQVLFFPEVYVEVTSSWRAPFSARNRASASSIFTALDGRAAKWYVEIPSAERVIAVQFFPWGAASWQGNPRIPSRARGFSSFLTAKAYRAAGQASSALYAMALLQTYQAKALKQLYEGSSDPGLMQELRTVTDLALRATKVTAWSLGQTMSTLVVQEQHLWLDLADMSKSNKHRFLNSPPLPELPNLPGRPLRRCDGQLCPAVLHLTEADGGHRRHPSLVARCCHHPAAGCSPSARSSPKAPSCCPLLASA